jgi:hypothetical protein
VEAKRYVRYTLSVAILLVRQWWAGFACGLAFGYGAPALGRVLTHLVRLHLFSSLNSQSWGVARFLGSRSCSSFTSTQHNSLLSSLHARVPGRATRPSSVGQPAGGARGGQPRPPPTTARLPAVPPGHARVVLHQVGTTHLPWAVPVFHGHFPPQLRLALPAFLGHFPPSLGSSRLPWALPTFFGHFPPSLGSSHLPWAVPVFHGHFPPSLGSSHLPWALPTFLGHFPPSLGTSHLPLGTSHPTFLGTSRLP